MPLIENLLQDVRYSVRSAKKSPGFLLGAAGMLALAIGANTAIFSIVSGVLLRPLPFAHPGQLVQIQSRERFGAEVGYYLDLADFRKGASVESTASYFSSGKTLYDNGSAERVQAVSCERPLTAVLGVPAMIGRTFEEADSDHTTVLSAGLWRRRFGGDGGIVGRKILLDHEPYTVIGVMPDGFQFPYRSTPNDLWTAWAPTGNINRNTRVSRVVARLRPGVSVPAAQRELLVIAQRLAMEYPATNRGRSVQVTPLAEVVAGKTRAALLTLLGAVGLVLFIACANITNLLLARASRRSHEVALRAALGAGRGRLIRQLLTESMLLGLVGGAGGLLVAAVGSRLIVRLASAEIPRAWEIGTDWRVFGFLLAASVATGVAFGIAPALTISRTDLQTALKHSGTAQAAAGGGSRSGRWFRDALVVAEIALSFVLLVSAGLLLRAFLRLQETPTGLAAENVLTMQLTFAYRDFTAPGSYARYVQEIEDRVRAIPGVRSAGFIQYLPLRNWGWSGGFRIEGRPVEQGREPQSELRYVSPSYFETMRIPLRGGRVFDAHDTAAAPRVILVNEALAHKYFPNEDPVGRKTDRGTIIGVVGDVRTSRMDAPATPEIYYVYAQNTAVLPDAGVSLVVSTMAQPEAMAPAVREAIRQVNPSQAIFGVSTMERVIEESLADLHLFLWLIGVFAAIAVLLAVSGVYGVISYVVSARTHEFGIRLALGARARQILQLVMGRSVVLVAAGIGLGLAGAIASGKLLRSLSATVAADEATLIGISVVLAGVAFAACLAPARRAMRVDPVVALKYE